jgi:beta-phosphoglucomutase
MNDRPYEAVIFDLDGTLIDTESPDFEACQMLCQEFGLSLSLNQWAEKIVGRLDGYDELFVELIQHSNNGLTPATLKQRLREYWQITLQNVQLMPGVERLLVELEAAGYLIGLATASDQQWTMRWLTHFELLPYFKVTANRGHIAQNKPAPDVYLFAATQLGVQPERCLVFEDSIVGVQAAKAAGMTVVAVPGHVTKTLDFSQADMVISGLQDVTVKWIEKLIPS